MDRKNQPSNGINKRIFRDVELSLEAGIDAAEATKTHPDALTQTEAIEIYLGNSASAVTGILQEALLAYVAQDTSRLREQIIGIRQAIESKANWKSKTKKAEKLLEGVGSVSPLEAEYLSGIMQYLRSKTSKSEESKQAKKNIDQKISELILQVQASSTAETQNALLSEALRKQATKGKTRFEMLIDTYSALSGQFISEEVMLVGKELTAQGEWVDRLEKAEQALPNIRKEGLNDHEKLYLRQAIGHIERYNELSHTEFVRNYGSVIADDIREIISETIPAQDEKIPETPSKKQESKTHPQQAAGHVFGVSHYSQPLQATGYEPGAKQSQPIPSPAIHKPDHIFHKSPVVDKETTEIAAGPLAVTDEKKQTTESRSDTTYENTPLPLPGYQFLLQKTKKQPVSGSMPEEIRPVQTAPEVEKKAVEPATDKTDIFAMPAIAGPVYPTKMVFADTFPSQATFERPKEDYLRLQIPASIPSRETEQRDHLDNRIVSIINPLPEDHSPINEQSDLFIVSREQHERMKRNFKKKVVAGAAASGTIILGGIITLAASSVTPQHDAMAAYVNRNPPVIITNPEPERKDAPVPAEKKQKESDEQYCYNRLMGEYEGSRMPLRKVKKTELPQIVKRCWLPQARRMNPDFLKGVDLSEYGNTTIVTAPEMADYIYVKTAPRTVNGPDGKDAYVIDTYFDPMGTSMIMSKWRSLRRGWIINSENGAMVCAKGQFKIPTKNKKSGKNSDHDEQYQDKTEEQGQDSNVVDATDIKPAAGLDKIVATNAPETATEDIADDSNYSGSADKDAREPAEEKPEANESNAPASQPATANKSKKKTTSGKKQKNKAGFACGRNHGGVDLEPAAAKNRNLGVYEREETAPIYSSREGYVVRMVKKAHLAGNYVVVWHGKDQNGNDIYSEYMHMKRFSTKLENRFKGRLLEMIVKQYKGKSDEFITSKYDEHLRKGTGMVTFDKGTGPFVVPHVLEELVHMQCQQDENLSDDEKTLCNREGASLGPMGGSGNATKEYAHLHYQHRIGDRLFNPELYIPVVDKGPGVDFDEGHAQLLVGYASLAGIDPNVVLGVRENEASTMDEKSKKGAAGFMQIMPCAVSMASAQCYLEKSKLEAQKKETEEQKKSAASQGKAVNQFDDRIREITDGIATYSGFCDTLSAKDAWKSVSEDPTVNMFAGVMILKRNYDRFGGDYEKAVAGYNRGPFAVEGAITNAQQELKSIEARIQKAETTGDVKGLMRLREQKAKINWKNGIGSTRAYLNRVMNYGTTEEAEPEEVETAVENIPTKQSKPAAQTPVQTQLKQSYYKRMLESNPYQRMQIRT